MNLIKLFIGPLASHYPTPHPPSSRFLVRTIKPKSAHISFLAPFSLFSRVNPREFIFGPIWGMRSFGGLRHLPKPGTKG